MIDGKRLDVPQRSSRSPRDNRRLPAIRLRSDYSGDDLRRLSRAIRDTTQTRRLLARAAIYVGGSRTMAARIGDVGLQNVQDWLCPSMSMADGMWDRKTSGKTRPLNEVQRSGLAAAI